ncbi:MAG TPA: hypothetical protein VHW23_05500 [Kofleriaceae bacterium]|nr:hypothetical protein [Kofleriaceae bacterium]
MVGVTGGEPDGSDNPRDATRGGESPLEIVERVAAEMAVAGRRTSSRFDAARFHALATGCGGELWQRIAGDPHAVAVLRSYLRLLAEAVGMGCLVPDAGGAMRDLLSDLLATHVPARLTELPVEHRAACLAMLWNLGEGLLQEPAWLNRFAMAFAGDARDLLALPAHLERLLEPVLAPRPPSQWAGPCTLAVLDPRSLADGFLPGDMHLAAPAVVCVHDRRRAGAQLGVLLEHGGRSRFLGATPCLGREVHEGARPAVTFAANHLAVAGHQVALGWLRAPLEKLVTATGFVVASTVDSQRLWVVDTP